MIVNGGCGLDDCGFVFVFEKVFCGKLVVVVIELNLLGGLLV